MTKVNASKEIVNVKNVEESFQRGDDNGSGLPLENHKFYRFP